jgi:hypothetical protein
MSINQVSRSILTRIVRAKILPIVVCLFIGTVILPGADQSTAEQLSPIRFLAGGVWSGELPAASGSARMTIELKAQFTPNNQALRFDSAFVSDGKRMPYTSGSYFWNAAKHRIVFMYADGEGTLTEGEVFIDNPGLRHEFTLTDTHGKVEKARAIITPHLPDTYTSDIFVEKEGAWSKMASVTYRRSTDR